MYKEAVRISGSIAALEALIQRPAEWKALVWWHCSQARQPARDVVTKFPVTLELSATQLAAIAEALAANDNTADIAVAA